VKLSEKQAQFLTDVALLIQWVNSQGWYVTGGELFRTREQQEIYVRQGKSKTYNSKHLKRLAIDLFLFKDGKVTWKLEDYRPLGEFWQSIRPENVWGGNFSTLKDGVHFERR